MTGPKGSPREVGGSERSEQGGVGDGTMKRARRVNDGPAIVFSYSLILGGVEFIIRLSIYSDLFFTYLSKSIAKSESLTVIG